MAPLTIHGNPFEADAAKAALSAETMNFITVQTVHALTPDEQASLRGVGALYEQEVADNTYVFRYDPTDLSILRELPFVKFVDIYHPQLKLSSTFERYGILRRTVTGERGDAAESSQEVATATEPPAISSTDPVWIAVRLHNNATETMTEIASRLFQSGVISPDTTRVISPIRMDTKAAPAHVPKIAAIDSVSTVDPCLEKKYHIDISRTILTDCVYSTDTYTEYTGEGQVVAVGDSGFDKGSTTDIHPPFLTGSILDISNAWGVGEPLNDTLGHGTHVCGCIALSTTSDMADGRCVKGTAPRAKLVVIRTTNKAGVFRPGSLVPDFLQTPYLDAHSPRLFSFSFGDDYEGIPQPYNNEAWDIDAFTFKHQDALVCMCAGNEGSPGGYKQIGGEAAAKNMTLIGGCDTTRPNDGGVYIPTKLTDNNPYSMSSRSNRGPTDEGRIKPDLVAPALAILSALSRDNVSSTTKWGISRDPNLVFKTGTSMATPAVAGCAAVIREAIVKHPTHPVPKPSGALVKALLINGAVPLDPQTVVPNNESGFGRVNVSGSLAHLETPESPSQPHGGFFSDTITAGTTKTAVRITVPVPEEVMLTRETISRRLRVTLVWFDVGGGATENKLYLMVKRNGGMAKEAVCGNRDINATDGSARMADLVNTVQRVDWVNIPAGGYSVDVTCKITNPANSPANFHVAWYLF